MKVLGLDGKEYKWALTGYMNQQNPLNKSKLHNETRELLVELFPTHQILEEVPLPSTKLKLDFFLPQLRIAIECQGEQHSTHTPFFHGEKLGFLHAKKNDRMKREWCELNNIKLVEIVYNESREQRKEKLNVE